MSEKPSFENEVESGDMVDRFLRLPASWQLGGLLTLVVIVVLVSLGACAWACALLLVVVRRRRSRSLGVLGGAPRRRQTTAPLQSPRILIV